MRFDLELKLARAIDHFVGGLLVGPAGLLLPRRREVTKGGPSSILLIKFHGIGNLVMMLPAMRALKAKYPAARIDLLTLSSNRGLLDGENSLSSITYLKESTIPAFLSSLLGNLSRLRQARYDAVIDFEQFMQLSALVSAWTGAPTTIGFASPAFARSGLYSKGVPYAEDAHMGELFSRLAMELGASPEKFSKEIALSDKEIQEALALLEEAGIGGGETLLLMHPGSSANLTIRRWPPERFGELARRLYEKHGVRSVVTGVKSELEVAEKVVRLAGAGAVNACSRLSLKGLAALARLSELAVSNDTSTVHVASAMGTPVVGLYGPNTPFLYGPTGQSDLVFYEKPSCSPCLTNQNRKLSSCDTPLCMEMITVDAVFEGISSRYFAPDGTLLPEFKKSRGGAGKGSP